MSSLPQRLRERATSIPRLARRRVLRPFVADVSWHSLAPGPGRVASFSERASTYAALALLDQRYHLRPSHLAAAELKVFSQNGEDGIIMEIMSRLGVERGHFIEFGIEDGREGNCVLLADVLAWSGLFLEGNAESFSQLSRRYAFNDRIETRSAVVTPQTVNDLFREQPDNTDLLSIDIDGQDYWVWRALSVIHPKVVVIEYNSAWGPEENRVEPLGVAPGYSKNFGASIGALRQIAQAKGYRLIYLELSGLNAFFVREDLAQPFPEAVTYRAPNYFLSGLTFPDYGPAMIKPQIPGAQPSNGVVPDVP